MKDSKKDLTKDFIKDLFYKKPKEIFTFDYRNIEEIKENCVFVIDTNVLLLPYKNGSKSLKEIDKVFKKLKSEERLFIPSQVAQEFMDNRSNKIKELYKNINDQKSKLVSIKIENIPIFEELEEFKNIKKFEKEANDLIKKQKDEYDKLIEKIKSWSNFSDPISLIYKNIFTEDIIIELNEENKKDFSKKLEERYTYKIPPGYKDEKKSDSGEGDLIIWFTILQIAEYSKKDLIFVSGDIKSDWCNTENSVILSPKANLINEFKIKSNNKSFHIIQLSDLLELFGGNKDVINKVREKENTKIKDDYEIIDEKNLEDLNNYYLNIEKKMFEDEKGIFTFRSSRTKNDGTIEYAKDYGLRAFKIYVSTQVNA